MNHSLGYVIQCHPADRRRFETAVTNMRWLGELREQGVGRLRSFPTLMTDVFCFFYLPEPRAKIAPEGTADRLNFLIMKYLLDSSEYGRLHSNTMLEFDLALAATQKFCEMLLEYLDARQLVGRNSPTDRPPKRVTIKGIDFVDKAKLGGDGDVKEAILVFAKEIEDALDAHRLLSDLSRSWGTEPGFLHSLPYEQRASLANRVKDNRRLLELTQIVGRFRALAVNKQRTRVAEMPHEVFDVTMGSDWNWFLQQELVSLSHPALRYDFYVRLLDGRIAQYDLRGSETVGKGSLVVCIDTSGPMEGKREVVSKAIALALLDIARLQSRNYVAILFSSRGQWRSIAFSSEGVQLSEPSSTAQLVSFIEGMLCLGSDFFGGGTDYETPLREAIRILRDDEAGCKDGDIVFITDDQCEVSESFLEEYATVKRQRKFSTFSVIIEEQASNTRTLRKFSDEVVSSFELTEEIAGRIFESV